MRRLAPLLAVLVLAAGLRLFGIGHGFPETGYVPDTHAVRGALGMAKEKNPVPPVGRYSTYPNLLPYVLLPVYGGQYAFGRVTGEWAGAGEFGQRLLLEPARAHRPARVVFALLGLGVPLGAYLALLAARRREPESGAPHERPRALAEDPPRCTALFGAYLGATLLLGVHFAVQERPWGPLTAFALLSCWPAALYVRSGRPKHLLWCAALAAAAAASHQAGLPMLGIAGLAWLFAPYGFTDGAALRARLVHGVAAVALFAALALAVGYNAFLVHGAPETVAGAEFGAVPEHDLAVGGQAIVLELRWASLARLSKAMVGYDPVVCLLALVGLVAALRDRATRVPTVFALAWLAFFTTNQNDHVRYLLPGLALLVVPAAIGARLLFERGGAWRVALYLLLLVPLVQSARLAWVLSREDTRALAATRMAGDLGADDLVAVDRYGPAPPPRVEALERLAELRELGARERTELEALRAGVLDAAPYDWVPLGELFVFDERHRGWTFAADLPGAWGEVAGPEALLDALGVTHVLLVDRDRADGVPPLLVDPEPALPLEHGPGAGEPAPKLPPLALAAEPLWEIGASASERRLPTELDFPLTSLWRVARPGPYLALYPRARR